MIRFDRKSVTIKINQVFYIFNARELSVNKNPLSSQSHSVTEPGQPCTRTPSCTTPKKPTLYDWRDLEVAKQRKQKWWDTFF